MVGRQLVEHCNSENSLSFKTEKAIDLPNLCQNSCQGTGTDESSQRHGPASAGGTPVTEHAIVGAMPWYLAGVRMLSEMAPDGTWQGSPGEGRAPWLLLAEAL
ncbi:unnamed protein product [Fusarium venenatum]|uniref:Uncharacterized protein n=1 Tax=Fusarium venenatum TaxID=56646 RepID=A0A2L2TG10_9HYPO|nr:uncharacterized protein FVRRES_09991 [Fusarium venenatum]CEI69914.1 unnamed protein product [Fusarium venenatum]